MKKYPNVNYWLSRNKVDTHRGAPMGRSNYPHPEGERFAGVVSVQECELNDGGYARDRTYWGFGPGRESLWMIMIKDPSSKEGAYYHFVWATRRFEAVGKAVSLYPKADVEGKGWWEKLSKIIDVHHQIDEW